MICVSLWVKPHASLLMMRHLAAQVAGMFWNYFSVGMDAASAHGFHQLRERTPWATTGRLVNQAWYSYYGLSTGWLTGAPPIRRKVRVWVRP